MRYLCRTDSLVTHFGGFRDIQLDIVIAWRGHCPRWLVSLPSVCICHFLLPELVSANPAGQGHTRQCCHVLSKPSFSMSFSVECSVGNSRPRFPQRPMKQERQVHVSGSSFGQPLQLPSSTLGPSHAALLALHSARVGTTYGQGIASRLSLIGFLHCWAGQTAWGLPLCQPLFSPHLEPRLQICRRKWC